MGNSRSKQSRYDFGHTQNDDAMLDKTFDAYADRYDAWYETEAGKAIFAMEVDCVKPFLLGYGRPYLEIGVGSGRFAQALGVEYGLDPAPAMLHIAEARGMRVVEGYGEKLPFPDKFFGGVLIVFTLEAVDEPDKVLREAWRVLVPEGGLVMGMLLKGSPWVAFYEAEAEAGHSIYSKVRFFSSKEIESMLQESGFGVVEYRRTLFQPPGQSTYQHESSVFGYLQSAGFVAISCSKQAV
jgi:ubiquinone/menaquinone biosynthesis C-methylase UbiE